MIAIVLLYLTIVNITYITDNSILIRTTINPKGTTYQYDDIKEVKVGYTKSGNEYYKILVGSKWIDISTPFMSNEKFVDTNDDLLYFNRLLMQNKPHKETDNKYKDSCDLVEKYKSIFEEIMNNK